jgi:SAM-dependent methyltransferase
LIPQIPLFPDHFSDRARAYAAHRPTYPAELLDYLLNLSGNAARVWEPGCGSGQLSALLAGTFAHVIATDASAEQLTHASPSDRISYHSALAEQAALAHASIDLIVVAQAAHWFDLPRFYGEARRVARGRTPLVLLSYGNTYVNAAVDAVVMPFHEFLLDGFWPPERAHVDSGYETLFFPFDDVAAPVIEMRAQWDLTAFLGYIETWSGVRALLKAGEAARFERLKRDVAQVWGDADQPHTVQWPLAIRATIL